MKSRVGSLTKSVLGLGVGTLLCVSVSVQAVPVTYNVIGGSSSITLSGNVFGLLYTGQGGNPAALVDSWGGTITGDLTAGVLTFTGGSSITALLNPISPPLSTQFYPSSGLDNYGPYANGNVPGFGIGTVWGVYRNLTLDITAGTATDLAAPSAMTMAFTGGSKLDYAIYVNGNPYQGSSGSLVGVAFGPNTSASLVSLSPGTGWGATLVLPVTLHTTGPNRNEFWTGTIVAVVPEPSSLALVGMGLLGLVTLRRCKRSL